MEENDPKNFRVVEESEDEIYEKIKELRTCLTDAIEENDREAEADALSFLGLAYYKLGNYATSKEYHGKHLSLSQELKDEKGERRAQSNLGCLYKITGDLETAKEHFIAALNIAKERDEKRPLAKIYNNLGNIYELETNYEEALNCNKERLAVAKELNDQNGIGKALANLGNLNHVVGNLKDSITYYEEMLDILRAKLSKFFIHFMMKNCIQFHRTQFTLQVNLLTSYLFLAILWGLLSSDNCRCHSAFHFLNFFHE